MEHESIEDLGGHDYYSALIQKGNRLNLASRRLAGEQAIIEAIACQVGADLLVVQAVIWEQLIVLSRNANAQLLAHAAPIFQSLFDSLGSIADNEVPVASMLTRLRLELVKAVQPSQAQELESRFSALDHFDPLTAVTAIDLEEWRLQRIGRLNVEEYVQLRRAESVQRMQKAQELRVSGAIPNAIATAYESDMLALDAYLIESAVASGDAHYFTVVMRWELAVESVSTMQGVPDAFREAVEAIRVVMLSALDGGDQPRMRARFPNLP
jgi:hypothetical protein